MMRRALLTVALALLTGAAPALAADADVLRREGAVVYATYCVGCHGPKGDGAGPATEMLIVKPRDFTKGIFKFRSTPSGQLPTTGDLYRTITQGAYGTSMPAWIALLTHLIYGLTLGVLQPLGRFVPYRAVVEGE